MSELQIKIDFLLANSYNNAYKIKQLIKNIDSKIDKKKKIK
jgi:hypothetical protein